MSINKKLVGMLGFASLGILGAMSFVSAQFYGDVSSIAQQTIQFFKNIFTPVFEALLGDYSSSEFFFVKILLLILLFVIINTVVKRVPFVGERNKAVGFIIALVVSLLAVRFMPDAVIQGWIQNSYSALGVAISTLIPFVIYMLFVHITFESPMARKAATALFVIVMGAIFWDKYSALDQISKYIFWGTLIAAIFLVAFDKQVRRYYGMIQHGKFVKAMAEEHAARLQTQYKELMDTHTPEAEKTRKRILIELEELGAKAE